MEKIFVHIYRGPVDNPRRVSISVLGSDKIFEGRLLNKTRGDVLSDKFDKQFLDWPLPEVHKMFGTGLIMVRAGTGWMSEYVYDFLSEFYPYEVWMIDIRRDMFLGRLKIGVDRLYDLRSAFYARGMDYEKVYHTAMTNGLRRAKEHGIAGEPMAWAGRYMLEQIFNKNG